MRILLLALIPILSAGGPAYDDEVLNDYELILKVDHWKGWKEGSWVQRKLSVQEGDSKRTAEYRITLDRIAENGYCFKIEKMADGKVASSKLRIKETYGDVSFVAETEKTEEVKIGEKTFKCYVTEYKTEGESAMFQKTLECKDAPGIIVMTLYEQTYEGKKSVMKQAITALGVEHAVGDKKVSCWKVEKLMDMPSGPMKTTISALYSADVPGGQVRREASTEYEKYKTGSLDEVVGFEGKK